MILHGRDRNITCTIFFQSPRVTRDALVILPVVVQALKSSTEVPRFLFVCAAYMDPEAVLYGYMRTHSPSYGSNLRPDAPINRSRRINFCLLFFFLFFFFIHYYFWRSRVTGVITQFPGVQLVRPT